MNNELDLIATLTGGLTAALVLGFLARRLKLSPVVGYLLAGVVVGPYSPGFVAHVATTQQFAELGVILLMFGVGIHLKVTELLAVRWVAIPGALLQVLTATALGALVTHWFGWSLEASIVFGLAISVASTIVLLRVFSDREALDTRAGSIALGWLLVEDLLTVFVLALLPVLVGTEASHDATGILLALGWAAVKIAVLAALTLLAGRYVIPRLLGFVARSGSSELFTLAVLVLALGIAVGSAELFDASMALGAFLAGVAVGQTEYGSRAASEALPMRDAFAVLFFVSVGMSFDPRQLLPDASLIAATLAVIMIGKPLAAFCAMRLLRQPTSSSVTVALSLGQIGEFSFILGALGRQLGVLPEAATQALVVASIVSIALSPLLVRAQGASTGAIQKISPS